MTILGAVAVWWLLNLLLDVYLRRNLVELPYATMPRYAKALYAPGICDRMGANAVTLTPFTVLFADRFPKASVVKHEAAHVRQARWLCGFFVPVWGVIYGALCLACFIVMDRYDAADQAYRIHPLELLADRSSKRSILR